MRKNQDLKMPNNEMSSYIERFNGERPWSGFPRRKISTMAWAICVANMCCGLGFPGQGYTVKNRGHGRESNGRKFELTESNRERRLKMKLSYRGLFILFV